jgi:hypothetical protein
MRPGFRQSLLERAGEFLGDLDAPRRDPEPTTELGEIKVRIAQLKQCPGLLAGVLAVDTGKLGV